MVPSLSTMIVWAFQDGEATPNTTVWHAISQAYAKSRRSRAHLRQRLVNHTSETVPTVADPSRVVTLSRSERRARADSWSAERWDPGRLANRYTHSDEMTLPGVDPKRPALLGAGRGAEARGQPDSFTAVARAKLCQDRGDVVVDGFRRDEQPASDLGVAQAVSEQSEHLHLTIREIRRVALGCYSRSPGVTFDAQISEALPDGGRGRPGPEAHQLRERGAEIVRVAALPEGAGGFVGVAKIAPPGAGAGRVSLYLEQERIAGRHLPHERVLVGRIAQPGAPVSEFGDAPAACTVCGLGEGAHDAGHD